MRIRGSVYFVDDNFIGNRQAAQRTVAASVEWQKSTGYRPAFLLRSDAEYRQAAGILAGMREAFFTTIFCGIETPDPVALKAMHKDHNMMVPIMESIQTINSYGMEVVSGIILGLDTDKPETGAHLLEFYRGLANSASDHQSASGAAQDPALGPPDAGEPFDRGRRAGVQCRFPPAV